MAKATHLHLLRGALAAVVLAAIGLTGLSIRSQVVEHNKATQAAGLVRRLLDANITQVPGIVNDIAPYRKWADPLLKEEFDNAPDGSRQKLRTSLALLPVDPDQVDYLFDQVLVQRNPEANPVIRDSLLPYKDAVVGRLWAVLDQPERSPDGQRIRAASLLARYDPESQNWHKCSAKVVEELVSENPIYLGFWIAACQPVKTHLVRPLSGIFRDTKRRDSERTLATNILAEYAGDQPEMLADLLLEGDDKQFAILFPKLKDHRDRGLILLSGELDKQLPAEAKEDDKERLAKRQASAAVALLRFGHAEEVWPRLKFSADPRMRSYLVHRLNFLGADPTVILKRLDEEKDVSVERALLLSLGEYGEEGLYYKDRQALQPKLLALYRDHPDPGIHASTEWLLRQWKQDKAVKEIDLQLAKDNQERAKRIERISQDVAKEQAERKPSWYVNGQGQTLVVLPGPARRSWPQQGGNLASRADWPHVRHCREIGDIGAVPPFPQRFQLPARVRAHHRLPSAFNHLVHGGGVLQLAKQTGGLAGERVVLRAEQERQIRGWHETGPGLSEAHRVPFANRGGMGICLSGGHVHKPLLRRIRGVAGQIRLFHG